MQKPSIVIMQTTGHKPKGELPLEQFLAAWIITQRDFQDTDVSDAEALALPLPQGASYESLEARRKHESSVFWHGVDFMLRKLQDYGANTCWATEVFFAQNTEWLLVGSELKVKGRGIKSVRLTPRAQEHWMRLTQEQQGALLLSAERQLQADCDEESDDEVADAHRTYPLTPEASLHSNPRILDRPTLIERLVQSIAAEPFQAFYRKRPHGQPVLGWTARLDAYFWPNTDIRRAETERDLADKTSRLAPLARKRVEGDAWTEAESATAVDVTKEIFEWGGVNRSIPQISVDTVRSVIDSAIAGRQIDGALMNSAWTKLASLASSALPADRQQAIWDSRVSHSLIGRIDALADSADVLALFPRLGWIPGQGGTRIKKPAYAARWKRGYRSWAAHFAAAAVIREMVDYLNQHAETYGIPAPNRRWSVRDVEMVLFMDGY